MNLSIIIPDHNDLKLLDLVASIDYTNDKDCFVELVIVLNKPTEELINLVSRLKINYREKFEFNIITVDICNLGYVYNVGIKNCKYDLIMFLDSDLVCEKRAIKTLVDTMKDNHIKIAKGKVYFEKKETFWGKIIYESRYATTTNVKVPYIPVIIIRKDIFKILDDGYMFPEDTVWCADADFAYRVLKKQLNIKYLNACFYHPSISVKKDIIDAAYYGFGKGIRVKRTKEKWNAWHEILMFNRLGKNENIHLISRLYLIAWCCIQQVCCGIQLIAPNNMFLKETRSFKYEESK